MIDTVRFQIEIEPELYEKIKRRSIEYSRRDNEIDREIIRILTKKFPAGSFDRHVNICLYDEQYIYLEFSLPKIFYGHNVYLISADQALPICETVRKALIKCFGSFPEVYSWHVKRLDLCYAWKLPSEYVAEQFINIFRGLCVRRKKHHFYDSSVMWYGREQAIKFYQKYPEFYAHDFKELKSLGLTDIAYQFLAISEGVLRFEVTLRGRSLTRYFTDDHQGNFISITSDFIQDGIIMAVLHKFLKRVFKLTNLSTMDNQTVFNKLKERYTLTEARNLFLFYKLLYSPDGTEKSILSSYSRAQVYKNISKLSESGIGISVDQAQIGFDFNIPSDFAVNIPRSLR